MHWRILGAALVFLLSVGNAHAQAVDNQNFDANRLRVTTNLEDILNTATGAVPRIRGWDVALWLNYANDPVTLNERQPNGDTQRFTTLLDHRIDAHFVASMVLLSWLQVGMDAPVAVYQDADDARFRTAEISARGVGDLGITARAQVLKAAMHGIDLAFVPNVTVSSATPRDSYFGERTLTATPELALSRSLSALTVAMNVAARFRNGVPSGPSLDVENELLARAAARYDFDPTFDVPLSADLTWEGFTQLANAFELSNARGSEVLAALGYLFKTESAVTVKVFAGGGFGLQSAYSIPDYRAFFGVGVYERKKPRPALPSTSEMEDNDEDGDGVDNDLCPRDPEDFDDFEDDDGCPDEDNDDDGVLDPDDACPNEFGEASEGGCSDRDGDGISDPRDGCPDEVEDVDTFEDEDGCPDPDNDGDGIKDVLDSCPLEAGDAVTRGCPDLDSDGDTIVDRLDNCPDEPGWPENNGCKKKQLVAITGCKIDLSDKIYFDSGRTGVKSRSYRMLNNLAEVLSKQDAIRLLKIEGHTDNRGPAAFNRTLSQQRADAVRVYLQEQGIDPSRLEATGYGEERPVAPNTTRRGRDANRRVELLIGDCIEDESTAP